MKNLVNKNIKIMKPYNPPIEGRRSYCGHLLDFNERTVPYGNMIRDALVGFSNQNQFQFYPEYGEIEKMVANYVNVKKKEIIVTNGSDQGIDLIFRSFTNAGDEVIIPSPSFAMFYQCAQMCGNKVITPTYDSGDGSFPLGEILDIISQKTKLIIICNPNNPTGNLVDLNSIEQILIKAKESTVLIDEAYFEYSRLTATKLIKKYPNLIITRTFSKAFGLAALRIGYIIANSKTIEELKKVRGPYDINMAGVIAVQAVLSDLSPLNSYLDEVMNISKPTIEKFFDDYGIFYYTSNSNFILFKPQNADIVFKSLKKQGFLLRPRKGFGFDNTLRLTFGTIRQTEEFIATYKNICLKN